MNEQTSKNWATFRDSGMLWYSNMNLHVFGWAIFLNVDNEGKVTDVFPKRVTFRGFKESVNDKGYKNITNFMANNHEKIELTGNINCNKFEVSEESVSYWSDFISTGLLYWLNEIISVFNWEILKIMNVSNATNLHRLLYVTPCIYDNNPDDPSMKLIKNYIKDNSSKLLEDIESPIKIGKNESTVVCRICGTQPIKTMTVSITVTWDLCNKCINKIMKKNRAWPIKITVPKSNKFIISNKVMKSHVSDIPLCWRTSCCNTAIADVFHNFNGDNCNEVLCEEHFLELLKKC